MIQTDNNIHLQPVLNLLRWFCPEELYEEIEGDLIQRYHRDLRAAEADEERAMRRAKRRLVWNVLRFIRPGIILRNNKLFQPDLSKINPFTRRVDFKKANIVGGWIIFAVAFLTYFLTVEETASYWDCSEFIATSYKLEVPHPPGAPLFLMMGRLFSFLAMGNVTQVAYAINMMSVLASAFTILFLFWSIVMVGRKLIIRLGHSLEENKWALLLAGAVGSLAYTFSDSFWFSAVEAEVYALSSFFTAFVLWAILKWDTIEDKAQANRWLILIAYSLGLSIGVHLLNLLSLPFIALIYYYKNYKTSLWGTLAAMALGALSVVAINNFIVPGLPTLAGRFEVFFVNTLGLFFGSGALTFIVLLTVMLVFFIRYTQIRKSATANTFALAISFIIIGYCSYAVIIIRSGFDPPINENAPKDVMSFVRYLKREQYVSWPILYGPYFTSNPIAIHYGDVTYVKGKEKYEPGDRKYELEYPAHEQTILPRTWYPDKKEEYQRILNLREGQQPTFAQNLAFLFRYQIGTMYFRYFMWNFAGRLSDEQGAGWFTPSEWMKTLPEALANKARNNFFMIPFLLGLLGMFYHLMKDTRNFISIMLLYFMLGIAIVLYLNSPPGEPRERDYIYVGSYYAFAFWIGLSALAIIDIGRRIMKNRKLVLASASIITLTAPLVMAWQGWDDHNRSNRFFSVDAASNELKSCDQNGVVFTGGDNDTFPLWYAQETEGCRTDLRVLVMSYCNAEWYIDQTTRKAYTSAPFKYTLKPEDYQQSGPNNYLPYADLHINSIDVKEYLSLIAKGHPALRDGDRNVLPSKMITLNIDKSAVLARGIIPKGMENLVVDQMQLKLKGNALDKADLLFLDLLATSNWERPIYLNTTSLSQIHLDIAPYAVQEGNAYRILPVKNPRPDRDFLVDTDKTYDRMINQFQYRGLDDASVYYTSDYTMQVMNHRSNLNALAEALIDKGDIAKAASVLEFSLKKMPDSTIPFDPSAPDTVSLLFKAGRKKRAIEVASIVGKRAHEAASYLVAEGSGISFELRKNIFLLGAMQRTLYENHEEALAQEFGEAYDKVVSDLEHRNSAGE